jgi:arylsulfatase A-like enzyme
VEDRYDQEVLFADLQVAKLLKSIRKVEANVAVFITADHGEKFSKTHRSHGSNLDEMTIRVPLLARVPGWKPAVVKSPVSLLDLFPTILGLTATPGPSRIDGIDLARVVTSAASVPSDGKKSRGKQDRHNEDRSLLTETWQFDAKGRVRGAWVAGVNGKRKVVLNRMDRSFTQYDQRSAQSVGEPVKERSKDPLAQAILQYVEETGGRLKLED